MQASVVLSPSPSLSGYSTGKLAEIAARFVDELGLGFDPFCCDAMDFDLTTAERPRSPCEEAGLAERGGTQFNNGDIEEAGGEEEEGEFDFASVYPVFNRDLLLNGVSGREEDEGNTKKMTKLRLPLKKLLSEEREWKTSSSSSSSELDELDRLPPGSYCVWMPK